MHDFFMTIPALFLSMLTAYALGALPFAEQISRRRGVDIFAEGTGLAGASNVRRAVGNWSGLIVLMGDFIKGSLTIILARFLGIEGNLLLLPAMASIMGHWKSIFTGFRGGDGLATLGGITIALFPVHGLISTAIAMLVSLGGQKMPYTSLLGIISGYISLMILNIAFLPDLGLTLGIGSLSVIVLIHASFGHIRRRRDFDYKAIVVTTDEAAQSEISS